MRSPAHRLWADFGRGEDIYRMTLVQRGYPSHVAAATARLNSAR